MIKVAHFRKKIKVENNIETLYKLLVDSVHIKGFTLKLSRLDESNLGIPVYADFLYITKWSWRSYSEEIHVVMEQPSSEFTTIDFLSQSTGFQLTDFGKNKRNWRLFESVIKNPSKI